MAENESTNEQGAAAQNSDQGPNFALQRLYLKDASFESPGSPEAFRNTPQWRPHITFDIKTRDKKLDEDLYDVVLVLTVEAKLEEQVAFLVEVQQGAIFTCKGLEAAQLEQVLGTVCPNIMFPYAREVIDSLVVKGSFPPLMLAPVNFDALYAQRKEHEAQQAAGNGADTASGESAPN